MIEVFIPRMRDRHPCRPKPSRSDA